MRRLNLDILKEGLYGISPARGNYYREAAIAGLVNQGFSSGGHLRLEGFLEEEIIIEWKDENYLTGVKTWKDEIQIANFGAVGIAVLLMSELLEFKYFEESQIGTGFDFWIGKKDMMMNNTL